MRTTAILSEKAHPELLSYISEKCDDIITVSQMIDSPIGSHADLYYCKLKDDLLFSGDSSRLKNTYPGDCLYNAASTGKFFIHNHRITDESLIQAAKDCGLTAIHVRQGYSKCSIAVIDESGIITSDAGIYRSCREDLDCLLISPGYIDLPGYKCGFIGGCTGRLDDTVIFNGNLAAHPDHETIKEFITKRGLEVKYFGSYPLTDIGSMIFVKA